MLNTNIVIVCSTGRNLSTYLKQHLLAHGIKSHAVGLYFKNRTTRRRIVNSKTIIFVHEEIRKTVEEEFDLSDKKVICLDVQEIPDLSGSKTNLTGEIWLEYQKEHAQPALERQIKKHLRYLKK